MIHDEHTMTLDRMQRMMITGNTRMMLKRGWLPRILVRKSYVKMMQYFDSMFGQGADKEFQDQTLRTAMWNKIHNILPMMHQLLATDKSELAEAQFKHYYGRDFKGIEDLEIVHGEIKRLRKRFKTMFDKKKETEEDQETTTFENVIQGVEMVLDKPHIPRGTTLYSFRGYYEQAQKVIKERNAKNYGKH